MSKSRYQVAPSCFSYACQWVSSKCCYTTSWISDKWKSETGKTIRKKIREIGEAGTTAYGMYFIIDLIGLSCPGAGAAYIGFKAAQYTTTAATFAFCYRLNSEKREGEKKQEAKDNIKLLAKILTEIDKKFGEAIHIRAKVDSLFKQSGYGHLLPPPKELGPESLLENEIAPTQKHFDLTHTKGFIFSQAYASASSFASLVHSLLFATTPGLQWSATILTLIIAFSREFARLESQVQAEKDLAELKGRIDNAPEKLSIIKESLLGSYAELKTMLELATHKTHHSLELNLPELPKTSSWISRFVDSRVGRTILIFVNGASVGGAGYYLSESLFPTMNYPKFLAASLGWTLSGVLQNKQIKNQDRFNMDITGLNEILHESRQLLRLAEKILAHQQTMVRSTLGPQAETILTEPTEAQKNEEEEANQILLKSVHVDSNFGEDEIDPDFRLMEQVELSEMQDTESPKVSAFSMFTSRLWNKPESPLKAPLLVNAYP